MDEYMTLQSVDGYYMMSFVDQFVETIMCKQAMKSVCSDCSLVPSITGVCMHVSAHLLANACHMNIHESCLAFYFGDTDLSTVVPTVKKGMHVNTLTTRSASVLSLSPGPCTPAPTHR